MEYISGGKRYSFSYRELQEHYERFIRMSDEQFLRAIVEATHFACFVSYLKELGAEATTGDQGIIHRLIHHMSGDCGDDLHETRQAFKDLLKLS